MAVRTEAPGGYQAQAPMKGVAWMAVAAVFFAVSVGLVRQISGTIDAFEQTFLRQFIGLLLILPMVWRGGFAAFRTRQIGTHFLRSLVGYVGIALSFYSVTLIPLAESLALQFTLPLFTIVFAMLVLGERVGAHRWAATATGFLGALVILRPGFAEVTFGVMVALGAAAFLARSDTFVRRLSHSDATTGSSSPLRR